MLWNRWLGDKIESTLFGSKQVIRCPEVRTGFYEFVKFVESKKFLTKIDSKGGSSRQNRIDFSLIRVPFIGSEFIFFSALNNHNINAVNADAQYPNELSWLLSRELNALHQREKSLDSTFLGLWPWHDPGMPACQDQILELLNKADVRKGKVAAQVCIACHSVDNAQNAPNWGVSAGASVDRIGPPLWGILGRPIASIKGFNYSPSLSGMSGRWNLYNLDALIANPQSVAPGTRMAVDAAESADIPAYFGLRACLKSR